MMLNITEINTLKDFLGLRYEWNRVLQGSKENNIFLTWEYLFCYWKHFGGGKRLKILVMRSQDDITAIAPLRQSRYCVAGLFHYNVVEPLAYRGLAPEGADYTGLVLAGREADCLQLFLNHLVEHNGWNFIYLMDVPETSINPDLLAKASRAINLTCEIEYGAVCPYIVVPDTMNVFLTELDSKFRKNLRRCMRNLERDHHRVELKMYDEFGSVEEAMKIFFELHQKRWKSKHVPGVFNAQKIRDFYLDVAKLFAEKRWLALYFLTADDQPIATQYCFEYNQKMYYALGGFDPNYSQYSVGNIILMKVIERCVEKNTEEYDLLKGGEQYKFRYTAKYRRNFRIRLANKKLTSIFYRKGIKTFRQTKVDKLLGRILGFG